MFAQVLVMSFYKIRILSAKCKNREDIIDKP